MLLETAFPLYQCFPPTRICLFLWGFHHIPLSQGRWHNLLLTWKSCPREKKQIGRRQRDTTLFRGCLNGDLDSVFVPFLSFPMWMVLTVCVCVLACQASAAAWLVILSQGAHMQAELPVGFPDCACSIDMDTLHMFAFLLENTGSWVSR